jgi:hypothetical protein
MKFNIKEYLQITLLGHVFIVATLSPWLIFIVGMKQEQYLTWLWQGSLIDMVLPFGIIKWTGYWMKKIAQKKLDK